MQPDIPVFNIKTHAGLLLFLDLGANFQTNFPWCTRLSLFFYLFQTWDSHVNSKDRVYASGRLPIHFSNVRFTCEFLLCFSLTWEFQVWKYFTVDLTKSRLKNKICIQFKPDPQLIHSWVTCENMRLFCTGVPRFDLWNTTVTKLLCASSSNLVDMLSNHHYRMNPIDF